MTRRLFYLIQGVIRKIQIPSMFQEYTAQDESISSHNHGKNYWNFLGKMERGIIPKKLYFIEDYLTNICTSIPYKSLLISLKEKKS